MSEAVLWDASDVTEKTSYNYMKLLIKFKEHLILHIMFVHVENAFPEILIIVTHTCIDNQDYPIVLQHQTCSTNILYII